MLAVILNSLMVAAAVLIGVGFIVALVTGGVVRLLNRGGG